MKSDTITHLTMNMVYILDKCHSQSGSSGCSSSHPANCTGKSLQIFALLDCSCPHFQTYYSELKKLCLIFIETDSEGSGTSSTTNRKLNSASCSHQGKLYDFPCQPGYNTTVAPSTTYCQWTRQHSYPSGTPTKYHRAAEQPTCELTATSCWDSTRQPDDTSGCR